MALGLGGWVDDGFGARASSDFLAMGGGGGEPERRRIESLGLKFDFVRYKAKYVVDWWIGGLVGWWTG